MSIKELDTKAKELLELKRMRDELDAEIEALQDAVKQAMIDRGEETLSGDGWKASWRVIEGTRLDGKALKAQMPEVAARFTVTTRTSRFVIA